MSLAKACDRDDLIEIKKILYRIKPLINSISEKNKKLLLKLAPPSHVTYLLNFLSNFEHIEIVKLIIEVGIDIHANNDKLFIRSCSNGFLEISKLLLEHGANVHADNDDAFRLACTNGHLEVVKLLLQNGANMHVNNDISFKQAKILKKYHIVEYLNKQLLKAKLDELQ
jgi:ankyrin repeat protein